MRTLLLIPLLALVLSAAPPSPSQTTPLSPACAFGGTTMTTFSIMLPAPHPEYTLWTTVPATYELQVPDADLVSGALSGQTQLVLDSPAPISLFVRLASPSSLFLCSGAARPSWVFLPLAATARNEV